MQGWGTRLDFSECVAQTADPAANAKLWGIRKAREITLKSGEAESPVLNRCFIVNEISSYISPCFVLFEGVFASREQFAEGTTIRGTPIEVLRTKVGFDHARLLAPHRRQVSISSSGLNQAKSSHVPFL
jgi:hypothetical protein